MNRILTRYVAAKGGELKTEMLLRDLTTRKNMNNCKSKAHKIMLNLVKFGIKRYMRELYDEEAQGSIIEQIFNQIILEIFKKEYQQVTTYKTSASENKDTNINYYYQGLVFNATDLMCSIFQFLTDFGEDEIISELVNCSLVNSHWLYHTWNPNSIYYVALIDLIGCTVKFPENKLYSRMWQRFYNVQKVYIDSSYNANYKYSRLKTTDFVLNKLNMFGNITNIDGFVPREHVSIIDVIMKKCGDKIERFSLSTFGDVHNHPPVTVLNAKFIAIVNMRLYSIWTNKCEKIEIDWVDNIKQEWCQHVIDKCDCSGVKSLTFNRAGFGDIVSTSVIKQFGQKFINLKHLAFEFYHRCDKRILLLWTYLNPVIVKNSRKLTSKCNVEMQIFTKSQQFKTINDTVEKNKIIINCIQLIVDDLWEEHKTEIIRLLSNERLEWLQITNADKSDKQFALVLQSLQNEEFLKQVKFDKIKKIEFQDNYRFGSSTIQMINQFLELNWIAEKKVFLITEFVVKDWNLSSNIDQISKSDFEALFEKLCQTIIKLMMKDKIAIDIKVTFEILLHDKFNLKDDWIQIFQKYFNLDKIMQSYEMPQSNKLYIGLQQPVIFFGMQDDWQGEKKDMLRVATAEDNSEMYA